MGCHRTLATTTHRSQKGPFRCDALQGIKIIEPLTDGRDAFIGLPDLNANSALADAGKHDLGIQDAGKQTTGNSIAFQPAFGCDPEVEPRQARQRKHGGVQFGELGQFSHAGNDVAANVGHFQTRIVCQQLRLASGAAGCDNGSGGQGADGELRWKTAAGRLTGTRLSGSRGRWRVSGAIDQDVAHIGARAHGAEFEPGGQLGRQIFQAVDGKVRLVLEQRNFEFLGKKTFGQIFAFFGEGGRLELITCSFDDFQLEREPGKGGPALSQNHVGLGERKRAASRGDEDGVFGTQVRAKLVSADCFLRPVMLERKKMQKQLRFSAATRLGNFNATMDTVETEPVATAQVKQNLPAPGRLASMDAYRGLVMFLIMAELLSFCDVARARPESGFWKFLCHQQSHVSWIGCSLHDLIQPSFSFLVGVALAFSVASRQSRGQSLGRMTIHAAWRSLALILLGVFLRSTSHHQTYWTFEDTLSQIGLGYFPLFLLAFRPARDQWIALAVILLGFWAAFALYPLPAAGFDYPAVGVPANWPHLLHGFAAHWNKNSNFAWAFDTWFLNLFPREKPFAFNDGGYATLSFIPTLGTMLLGLLAGGVLRGERTQREKLRWLAGAGLVALLAGLAFGIVGLCPVVKRIWTPSWVLFSGGWCFLFMAGFYLFVDVRGHRRWVFPLVVIGMNSIAAYCSDHLFDDFIYRNLAINLGQRVFRIAGDAYEPLVHGAATLVASWLLLFWLYRRKIFIRI